MKAYTIKVFGRVQRVGYRRYILDLAHELRLRGYVKNEKDGSVAIFVQGGEEELKEFIDKAGNPPKPALVKEFKIEEADIKPEVKYFEIKPGELWEEFHEGFGTMQSIFMEYWSEFREFSKRTDENFKVLSGKIDGGFKIILDKYGEISEKLTTILDTLLEESKKTTKLLEIFQKESKETREMINQNIVLLREAVEKLAEK